MHEVCLGKLSWDHSSNVEARSQKRNDGRKPGLVTLAVPDMADGSDLDSSQIERLWSIGAIEGVRHISMWGSGIRVGQFQVIQ